MKNGFFTRLANKVSGGLLLLKRKVNNGLFRKNAMLFRSRLMEAKSNLRGMVSGLKSHLLTVLAMLRLMFSAGALRTYRQWCREKLNPTALKKGAARACEGFRNMAGKLTWANISLWCKDIWNRIRNRGFDIRNLRKYAVLASIVLVMVWIFLVSDASLAWLTHTTPTDRNSFTVGEMDLKVEYQNQKMDDYAPMAEDSVVFDEEALYEPGYTQVVYFKIINDGNVPFDYQIEVNAIGHQDSVNVYGETLHLPRYLKFGIITAEDRPALDRKIAQAEASLDVLDLYPLGYRSDIRFHVAENEMEHAALIVCMPKEVGNEANYRKGEKSPAVYLGITVYAQQAGTMGKELP